MMLIGWTGALHTRTQDPTTGEPSVCTLEELLLAADEMMQEKLYDTAGSITSDEFQAAQETLRQWQKLSQELISIIDGR